MVKTILDERTSSYTETQRGSAIDLLERKTTSDSAVVEERREETYEQAKERMQSNLQKLLNYDRFSEVGYVQDVEMASSVVAPEKEEVVEEKATPVAFSDEDIKPTSTTLQFGDGEVDKVYSDMQRQKEAQKASFSLNGKGKLVVVLYSLAVTVILALIILNTGVLASIRRGNEAKASVLREKVAEYQVVSQKIDSISSNDYVIEVAENDYGMIKGN